MCPVTSVFTSEETESQGLCELSMLGLLGPPPIMKLRNALRAYHQSLMYLKILML